MRRTLCVAVGLVTLTVLVGGWALHVDGLTNIVPGTVGMKATTAVALLLAALGVELVGDTSGPRRLRLGLLCGLGTAAIGVAAGAQYVLGVDLGIDELFFRDTVGRTIGIAHPGRLAPTTAACLVLVGSAIVLLGRSTQGGWGTAERLVLPCAAVATLSSIGYLYEIPAFYGPASAAKMALTTAACVLGLVVAVLLARPHGRLVQLMTTTDPGGVLLRRLLPVSILMPLALGFARLRLGDAGVFGQRVGTWWLSAVTIAVLCCIVTRVAAKLSAAAARQREMEVELQHLASRDGLTGLFNRRRFDEELRRAGARVHRYEERSTLLVMDFDRMKRVNDELGHAAGDRLIEAVGALVAERVRTTDVAGRLGGDEFGVLLANTDLEGARRLAEDLCRDVRGCRLPVDGGEAWTTISVGIAVVGVEAAVSMAGADAAMYRAKRAGGDRVQLAGDAAEPVSVLVRP
jgi:diguanylate cyclase (GGDEF)-like protein